MRTVSKLAKIATLSIALSCTGALLLTTVSVEPAFAKSDKAKDKSSKDKSSKNKASKSKRAKNKADKKTDRAKSARTKPQKPKKRKSAALASEEVTTAADGAEETELSNGMKPKNIRAALGALNAANASEQAMANASPNSRVGKIAAYRDQVLANEELRASLDEAEALHNLLDAPDMTPEDYATAVAESAERQAELEARIATLETEIEAAEDDAELVTALIATQEDLDLERSNQSALVDPASYYESQQAIADGREALDEQEDLAGQLLDDAANKPVTGEVVIEVHRLLGLPEPAEEDDAMQEEELASVPEY